jgi:rod shape-determining protein MreC
MDTFMGRYRNVTILAAAVFIQLVGLAVQIKRRSEDDSTRLIRVWAVTAVTPFEKAIVHLQSGVTGIWHNYFYLRGVRQENRQLQEQIQQMQLEQVRLKQDAEQAHRLQALLGFKEQFISKTVAAQVIGSSGSEQSRLVYIDKGSDDGIKTGMPVITASGVVGKVSNVTNGSTSQVLLINDQNSGVGTILQQSRLQGVVKGRTSGELVLDNIMSEEEVKPGDQVLTSGGDLIFPKGLPVGTVAKVKKGNEFLQVTVRPAAALNHLEEVLVITQQLEREPAVAGGEQQRAADILAQRLPSVPDAPPATITKPATNSTALAKPVNDTQAGAVNGTSAGSEPVTAKPKIQQPQLGATGNLSSTGAAKPQAPVAQPGSQAASGSGRATHLVPAAVPLKPAGAAATANSTNDNAKTIPTATRTTATGTTTHAADKPATGLPPKSAPVKPTGTVSPKPAGGAPPAQSEPSGETSH